MRSMVEGASDRAATFIRPLHRLRRSPSPIAVAMGEEPASAAGTPVSFPANLKCR
jgi:hypothetical protein